MHLSDRLMQQCLAQHLPLALRQALPKPLISGVFAFSHPSQNRFCRGTGAKPSKLIVLAFLLSNTEVFAEVF